MRKIAQILQAHIAPVGTFTVRRALPDRTRQSIGPFVFLDKVAGLANVAILTNEADVLFANPGVFMPYIKAGRLRSLGVASLQRIAVLPEAPTFVESGFPGFESGSWYGLAALAGTPPAVISLLHREAVRVLGLPEISARLALDGASPVGNTPQEFAQQIRDDIARWANVVKTAGIKL